MTAAIIISFCVLLLIAYVFDLTSGRTRIPSVILLLLLGWGVRQLTMFFGIGLPDLTPFLPILGTVGLVLIVLEGSLELELNASKIAVIRQSFWGALLPMVMLAVLLALAFRHFGHHGLKASLLNAIPLCVISSAIAIPSVRYLSGRDREFIVYESSLSDILGVLLFNFMAFNATIDLLSFGHFALQMVIIIIVSVIATVGLAFLLSRIEHHIKFVPITLLVVLIYEISKVYHLPALIFILLFALTLGNLDKLKPFRWVDDAQLDVLGKEVKRFKELTVEAAFLVRTLFFLLFGYLIDTAEVIDLHTLPWAIGTVGAIYVLRAVQLRLSHLPLQPLLFVAPRGLITVLLFLSIAPADTIALMNRSLIIQVVVLSALIMMFGLMTVPGRAK